MELIAAQDDARAAREETRRVKAELASVEAERQQVCTPCHLDCTCSTSPGLQACQLAAVLTDPGDASCGHTLLAGGNAVCKQYEAARLPAAGMHDLTLLQHAEPDKGERIGGDEPALAHAAAGQRSLLPSCSRDRTAVPA